MSTSTEIVWKGNPALESFLAPLGTYERHPKNPRRGNVKAIAESLAEFGQQRPAIVQRETGWIVAGNHQTLAAEENGWTHYAYIVTDLDEDQSRRFLLADNRTSDLGEYDLEMLVGELRELENLGALVATGYSPEDLDDLIGQLAESLPEQDFKGGYAETPEEIERRRQLRSESAVMREVVLMMDDDQYQQFSVFIKRLMREWEKGGVTDTIYEAVKRQAESL